MRAVITAGGTVDGAFAEAIGTPVKALAPWGTGTLLDAVLAACAGAGVERTAVVGGAAVRAHLAGRDDVRVLDAVDDGSVNVLHALDAWPGERIVYLTSDLPFAGSAGVRDLIARSAPYALTMGIAGAGAYRARFPGAADRAVRLGRERVVNACGFVIAPEAVAPLRGFATRFFAARKSLLRMALLLGPAMTLRFALRRLEVAGVEAFAARRLGIPVGAIRDCDPGLCYDVDALDDYRYACALRA
ncbi:MAG TPA: NTP transferase domain-containing protein [Candidatus Sulfotelmatobacter sp.]|nr:NTP transferase domain-containing protein [Candidatus Sulfotelmatobacter sp.]